MTTNYDPNWTEQYYDQFGTREWDRLVADSSHYHFVPTEAKEPDHDRL